MNTSKHRNELMSFLVDSMRNEVFDDRDDTYDRLVNDKMSLTEMKTLARSYGWNGKYKN